MLSLPSSLQVANGFSAAGYASIHMDDCWEEKNPPRDPVTKQLRADTTRFPNGMKALGDYIHGKGLGYAIYTAESTETCGGYPASLGYETPDAQTSFSPLHPPPAPHRTVHA
jgi:alpha-galactosidase